MKKNIEITLSDINGWEARSMFCSQVGYGKQKRLEVVTEPITKKVWFEIYDHNKNIYSGPDINETIEFYNNI